MSSVGLVKREVNGILLLDKPLGLTSNAALQQVKHLYKARKAGHTGSLDPLASGMLPICFGEATKFSQYLLDSDKSYWVKAQFGVTTTTGDAEGEIVEQKAVEAFSKEQLVRALDSFRGESQQIPSMYSAIKHNGQPLYKLARQGIEVERKSRTITIYDIQLLSLEADECVFTVSCSKGTYVRSLVEDLGKLLGCGAHVTGLRRTTVGPYQESAMVSIEQLTQLLEQSAMQALDSLLLSVSTSVNHWPALQLCESATYYMQNGQAVRVAAAPKEGWVTLSNHQGHFLGVGEILDDGRVAPRRLVKQAVKK